VIFVEDGCKRESESVDEAPKSLVEIVESMTNPLDMEDQFVNVFAAALSTIPFAGGPISMLFREYIPTQKMNRLIEFARAVAESLESLSDQFDEQYIRSDRFA